MNDFNAEFTIDPTHHFENLDKEKRGKIDSIKSNKERLKKLRALQADYKISHPGDEDVELELFNDMVAKEGTDAWKIANQKWRDHPRTQLRHEIGGVEGDIQAGEKYRREQEP